MWIELFLSIVFLIGKSFVNITIYRTVFQKGCATCIAGQFVHRHQAMDAISPRKAPENVAVKRAHLPPKTFLFR